MLPQIIRDLPTSIKAAASIATALSTIIGAGLVIDSRYASAADVQTIQQQVRKTEKNFSLQMYQKRQEELEDKIFVIETKKAQAKTGKLDPIDDAVLSRSLRQLQQVQQQQIELQKLP